MLVYTIFISIIILPPFYTAHIWNSLYFVQDLLCRTLEYMQDINQVIAHLSMLNFSLLRESCVTVNCSSYTIMEPMQFTCSANQPNCLTQ